ncbi:D-aminoacyl-tRNA deacylase [Methanoregula sp.]|uniref:D-aminoacyl-tRNA deacylase n=1 Tax=Methanoregula sp. TaxID=2052170 RepID=UPI002B961CE0|nr:D-aminoacyl-tRNA deacylase [Methanoregula sp.]HVP96278.1 D-aminoacyl-tRNA deacylase [Methanoregula sp.]
MKVALINSREDRAGCTIRHHIEQCLAEDPGRKNGRIYDFFEVGGRLIHAEGVDAAIDCDLVIFLSRHSSVNPVPVLTVHATGNFGEAQLGGISRVLAPSAPAMMQATLRALARHCPEGYRISYEVTHHGPTGLSHPSFFVEIGSTEREWADPAAGRAVAEAVLDAVPLPDAVPLVGFGGTHYAVRETEIALSTRGAFGHIASSRRQVADIDREMVQQMIRQCGAVAAYIDKKSLDRGDLERLTGIIDSLGIPRLSESELASLGRLPWETYRAIRDLAGTVAPGTRCYIHALAGTGPLTLVSLDPVLVAEAAKTGEAELVAGLSLLPVAHLATQDNRLLPRFVVLSKNSSEIINALNTLCVKILRNKESTATENDYLVIRRVRFDPVKARELGVPAGPAYRQLAAGQAVEYEGQVITPDRVSVITETRIHIPGLENYS